MSWRRQSYEVLPALSVRRRELRHSLRMVTVAWMFGVVWMVGVGGSHVRSFCRMLGFDDFAFGLMNAIPSLAAFVQIAATIMVERSGLTKFHFIEVTTISRAMWLLIPLIPLVLPAPSPGAVAAMLAVLTIATLMAHMGAPAWYTWMGDLIPRRIRGRYMAQRDRLCKLIQVAAVIIIGIIIDQARVAGAPETATGQPRLLITACIVLFVGAVFGVVDILTFYGIREIMPPVAEKFRQPAVDIRVARPKAPGLAGGAAYLWRYAAAAVRQVLVEPLADRSFRYYVGYGLVLTFAMTVGGWYYWLLAMEHLGLGNLATMSLFMAIGPFSGILSAGLWGRLIDRWGRRPVLIIATSGIAMAILPWFLARPDTPCPVFVAAAVNWASMHVGGLFGRPVALIGPHTPAGAFMIILCNNLVSGSCWVGVNLAQTGIQLGFADGEGRSKYVASSAVLMSIGGVLGGLVGGTVTEWLHNHAPAPFGPFRWVNWHAALAIDMCARMAALALAIRMPDPGSGRVRDILRLFGVNVYSVWAPRLFLPLRLLGWRREHGDAPRDQ